LADKGFAPASTSGAEMPDLLLALQELRSTVGVLTPVIAGDGVRNIYIVSNPEKLERLLLLQTLTR
jgi:hypothetical protein